MIAWILSLGPGAPDGPPEFTAYRELQQLRCARVFDRVDDLTEPAQTLYEGAAHACLAATKKGESDRWPRAVAALEARAPDAPTSSTAWTARRWRCWTGSSPCTPSTRAAPSPLAAESKSKAPPCPAIAAIAPDRGVEEETVVRLTGKHLGDDVVSDVTVLDSLGNSLAVVRVDASTARWSSACR